MKTAKNKEVYEHEINGFKGKANWIIFPESAEEIQNSIKLGKSDIIIRGGGTSFTGACLPNNSIVIDMSKMKKIIEINPSRKIVYVEAGVLIDELNQELEKYNLELPASPMFSGIRTIGGVIATNASGDREIKYGRIGNWIESLEVINGKGEFLEIKKTDSSDFVGMEGLTGVILRAKLRLTSKKQRTLSIYSSDTLDDILSVSKGIKLDHDVCMISLFGRYLSSLIGLEKKYHLIVEYEGNQGNMKGFFYEKFMQTKKDAYFTLASNGYTRIEDPKLFAGNFNDFILYLEKNNIPYFCNLGLGVIYPCFKSEDSRKREIALEMIKHFRARVSYSFGFGLTKKGFLDKNEQEIAKRIKLRHDPQWKFSKGKMIDFPEEVVSEIIPLKETEPEKSSSWPVLKIEPKIKEEPEIISVNSEICNKEPELISIESNAEKEISAESQKETKEKTPEQAMLEFIEEQQIDDLLSLEPADKLNSINPALESTQEKKSTPGIEEVARIAKEIMDGNVKKDTD